MVWRGVRKEPVAPEAAAQFAAIRIKLAESYPHRSVGPVNECLTEAITMMRLLVLTSCQSQDDARNVQQVMKELEIWRDWNAIKARSTTWFEGITNSPQAMFLMVDPRTGAKYLGRHTLSPDWIANKIPEIFCSRKEPYMILGKFKSSTMVNHLQGDYWAFEYEHVPLHTITSIFSEAPDLNFEHPWTIQYSGKDLVADVSAWDSVDPQMAEMLGNGEAQIRKDTVAFLSQFEMEDKLIYDPACSTGQFLTHLKKAFPGCITVGQDISPAMCDLAKKSGGIDRIIQGDAASSDLEPESADFVFIRFLNSEVVSRADVPRLLEAILTRVKPEGYVIILGHTPVLVTVPCMIKAGLTVHQCSVKFDIWSRYQYYICQKSL